MMDFDRHCAENIAQTALPTPVADLLLTVYRRIPVDSGHVEVTGDGELVGFWLERVGFG
jgi:hypothetical protein